MEEKLSSKCVSCGNTMMFDPESQNLKCSHCGGAQVINALGMVGKKEYNSLSRVQQNNSLSVTHECETCGAKTNVDDSKVTGVCPYCGASNLHELSQSIEFKPDGILPFKITKQTAVAKYKEWIKTRKFVPNKLKSGAKVNKMEGVYFPCWNFDFAVSTTYSGIGVENHTRTVRRRGPDGRTIVDHEHYTTTHPFSGTRNDNFKDFVSVAGNHVVNQTEYEKLGRFGFNESLKVYNPAYLLGFASSEFTSNLQNGYANAKLMSEKEIEHRIKRQHSYDSYMSFKMNPTHTNIMWNYIYLPVWVCGFKFGKKDYRFLVNGATGYVTGKVPRSGWKIFGLVLGILIGVAAIGFGIYTAVKNGSI